MHSVSSAQLTDNYADRSAELNIAVTVAAATGLTLAATYTVGANIQSWLEACRILIENTTAASQVGASVRINRDGAVRIFFDLISIAGAGTFQRGFRDTNLKLFPGDVVEFYYNNADGAGRAVQIAAWFRETDL